MDRFITVASTLLSIPSLNELTVKSDSLFLNLTAVVAIIYELIQRAFTKTGLLDRLIPFSSTVLPI